MFVKINEDCVANTDRIVWVDVSTDHMIVKLTDGSEHTASDEGQNKLNRVMSLTNNKMYR